MAGRSSEKRAFMVLGEVKGGDEQVDDLDADERHQ